MSDQELLQPVRLEDGAVSAPDLERRMAGVRDEEGDESANATLDYFLGNEPDLQVFNDVEIKRNGMLFRLVALDDDQIKNCRDRSKERQSRQEKQRGMPAETDEARMRTLLVVEATVEIRRRLRSKEEAEQTGKPEFGPAMSIRDPKLLNKYRRPEDFLRAWTLPGERQQMATAVLDYSGWDENAIEAAKN